MRGLVYSSISLLPMAVVIRNRVKGRQMKEDYKKKYFGEKSVKELKDLELSITPMLREIHDQVYE